MRAKGFSKSSMFAMSSGNFRFSSSDFGLQNIDLVFQNSDFRMQMSREPGSRGWGNRWPVAGGTRVSEAQSLVFKKLYKNPLEIPEGIPS